MKDYLQDNFSKQMTYAQLRIVVQEAWDSITVDQLNELIDNIVEDYSYSSVNVSRPGKISNATITLSECRL